MNLQVKPGPEFIGTYLTGKASGFSRLHEFTKPVGSKKETPWKAASKRSAVSVCGLLLTCGLKVDSYPKIFRFQKHTDSTRLHLTL